MEAIIFTLTEAIYYLFLSFLVTQFNSNSLANSCIILFLFSMAITFPSLTLINAIKDRKKYFMISSILITATSLLILIFRNFSSNGILNFAFYLYTTLFMLIPFSSLFTLSIHKLCIPNKKRKQLVFLIVSKKIIILFFTFIFSFSLKFNNLLIFISVMEFVLNLITPFISSFLLKYQD